MLKLLKEMQKQGIFKMEPDDNDLDGIIRNAICNDEVEIHLTEIQEYIRRLNMELSSKYSVPVADSISDFYDKFNYELFDLPFTKETIDGGKVYKKNITFGKAGIGQLGLSSQGDIKFRLDERKLLKLANHHYIKLKMKEFYDDKYFYIPLEHLKAMYSIANNKVLKDSIIEVCKRINDKQVYWALNNTKYRKLKKNKLDTGKKVPLLDITIVYLPKKHQKGINGFSYEIKGLLCKVTSFMKMRYQIKQIANMFPVTCLKSNYLEYVITDKIIYQLNILHANNQHHEKRVSRVKPFSVNTRKSIEQKIKSEYDKNLGDLAREIYLYKNNTQHASNYLYQILNTPNSKRQILEFLEAVKNSTEAITMIVPTHRPSFVVRNREVFFDGKNGKKNIEDIYQEIFKIIDKNETRGRFQNILRDGEVKLRIGIVV